MGTALELVVAILLPTAAGYAALGGFRVVRWFAGWRINRGAAGAAAEPVERLGATLRRLRAELESVQNQMGTTAKGLRLRALRAAYIDALCAACLRLEVSPPPGAQARRAEIYRVEAALRQRGLDVRDPAAR